MNIVQTFYQDFRRQIRHNFHCHYEAKQIIGEGSFAEVCVAVHKITQKKYAVKCINKKALQRDEMDDLIQEVKILLKLRHPNIIHVHEIYDDEDENFYMVMELATGGALFERIKEKVYSEQEARHLIFTIASTLDFCHSKKIIHRDLKPENILFSNEKDDACIKIADFGFATQMIQGEKINVKYGTPGYYAPEMLKEGTEYDSQCDLWSLGVIMYTVLSGFLPFYDNDPDKEEELIRIGVYDFPSPQFNRISNEAKHLIGGMLTSDPKKRLTARQVMNHPWCCKRMIIRTTSKPLLHRRSILRKKWKIVAYVFRTIARIKILVGLRKMIADNYLDQLLRLQYLLATQDLLHDDPIPPSPTSTPHIHPASYVASTMVAQHLPVALHLPSNLEEYLPTTLELLPPPVFTKSPPVLTKTTNFAPLQKLNIKSPMLSSSDSLKSQDRFHAFEFLGQRQFKEIQKHSMGTPL